MSTFSTTAQTQAQTVSAQILGVPPNGPKQGKRGRWVLRSRLVLILYALMLPTLVGMLLITFIPQFSAIQMSFYNWDGEATREPIGFKNYIEAFTGDSTFWACFQLVGILLIANLVKMWPSIMAAVALHRIKSERAQYIYRVLFVLPMIIPGLVMLLMWKSFYDPTIGILNIVLNKTGIMHLLLKLDTALPAMASSNWAVLIRDKFVGNVFGGAWGLILLAVVLLSVTHGLRGVAKAYFWWLMLAAIGFAYFIGSSASLPEAIIRWSVVMATGLGVSALANDREDELPLTIARIVGGVLLAAAVILIATTMIWTQSTGKPSVFLPPAEGLGAAPSWLGNPKLIIPAIIFWGFPWIGTVGVLIYLAGLEGITTDVYEAAELDGVGSIRKLFSIELPLIMTQVRINLIFMTIGTLGDYGLMLLLLGPDGGPGRKGMVPGLYTYRAAFIDGRFGYACALGIVMFVIILFITIVYQKYVRVEK